MEEINVVFDSPIHCFSKTDGVEVPLEIKLHRGGMADLERKKRKGKRFIISK